VAKTGAPVRRNPHPMPVRATMIEPPNRTSERVAGYDSSPRDSSNDAAHGIPLEKRRRRQAAPRIVECDVVRRFNFGDAAGSNNPAEGGAAPSQRSGMARALRRHVHFASSNLRACEADWWKGADAVLQPRRSRAEARLAALSPRR